MQQPNTTTEPRPTPTQVRRVVLGTYGQRNRRPPLSSIATYERMANDYAIAAGLAILGSPAVRVDWTMVVQESPEAAAAGPAPPPVRPAATGPVAPKQPSASEQIADLMTQMIAPIWRGAVKHMLTALSMKAAPFLKQFSYRTVAGRDVLWLDGLKPIKLRDAVLLERIVEGDGGLERKFGGMAVRVVPTGDQSGVSDLGIEGLVPGHYEPVEWWRTAWFAIDSEDGELVGKSQRMELLKRTWWSKTSPDGAQDVEDIWFRKYVYGGCVVTYPEGTTQQKDGSTKDNSEIALDIGTNFLAGGVACIPIPGNGTKETNPWSVMGPEGQKKSDELGKQIDDRLDRRLFLGLFVSAMIAGGSPGEGSTFALANVLFDVLTTHIEDIISQICDFVSRHVVQPIVEWNWGSRWSARIEPAPLSDETVAVLRELIKALFQNPNLAPELIKFLDLGGSLEQAGLPLADDATDRIAAFRGTPAMAGTPGVIPAPAGETVQEAALNGAQISSLLEIVTQAASRQLPLETVKPILQASFPALPAGVIDAILRPLVSFHPGVAQLREPGGNRTADELVDRASQLGTAFWDDYRQRVKKKLSEAASETN
jgi:hypothetical protein